MFNSKWGVYQNNSISKNSRILNYEGVNENNEPMFSLVKSGANYVSKSYDYVVNAAQCWQVQFGLKYMFN